MTKTKTDQEVDSIIIGLKEEDPPPEPNPEYPPTKPLDVQYLFSDNIGTLAGAMSKAQGVMTNGLKDTQGYNYRYLSLDSLVNIVRKPLSDNDLALVQWHRFNKSGTNPSVITYTRVMHKSNQWMQVALELPIHSMSQLSAAQMIGVCCTYARRYSIQSICMIAAEDDNDATLAK